MRFFLKYLFGLSISLAVLTWLIPARYGLVYPARPGPQFTKDIRRGPSFIIESNQIEVVLIGDSTLDRSVDVDIFSQASGYSAHVISTPASSTALWYLALKNIIIDDAVHRPRYVVIMFRDTILTIPNFHVQGGRINEIDEFATDREDFLLQTAYLNYMNPLEIAAERYFPLYGARQRIKDTVEAIARSILPRVLLGCQPDCTGRAITNVFFNIENINPDVSQGFLMSEETNLYTRQAMDFDSQLGRSFLPEIIRLAKANDIQLVFVRSRTLTFDSPGDRPRPLSEYEQHLAAYLAENGIPLLSYSFDPRLSPSLFSDPLHMTEAGREFFSRLFGEEFRTFLP